MAEIPVFVRGGALIPFAQVQQYCGEADDDTVLLQVWPGGQGEFTWYEDDGESEAYTRGAWYRRRCTTRSQGKKMIVTIDPAEGSYRSRIREWQLAFWNPQRQSELKVNGQRIPQVADAGLPISAGAFPNSDGRIVIEFDGY